jgi:DNA recombination protein RmuC
MIFALLAIQSVTFVALLILLLRKPSAAPDSAADPRLEQLLGADLPSQITRLDAHFSGIEAHLRGELAQLRNDTATASAGLRGEVLSSINTLGETLRMGLEGFRKDNSAAAETLRLAIEGQLAALTQRFSAFTTDSLQHHAQSRDALHTRLNELGAAQIAQQDKLRSAVEERLLQLNQVNEKKLEEMRLTVDEKLQKTLHSRLTESFGAVTDQLSKVHAGLGEMNSLTTGVNDLNRIFSNVKSRGGFAEVQLGKLLDQVLAPGQYVENATVRPNTQEVVEFAVRFPGSGGDVLLPIDAKFPREDWERLESAYETGATDDIDRARKAFDAAIRTEGKRICSKYINEPVTTPYAIMFLPTEGLYAEVLRRDGLQADLHQNCRVMVAGPSNLYALLTSFQLGFRMLNLQKKGNEVWNILAKTQNEFGTFETLMSSMEKQVGTVQNTIQKLGVRTRAINRTLRDVSGESSETPLGSGLPGGFDGLLPQIAASEDD